MRAESESADCPVEQMFETKELCDNGTDRTAVSASRVPTPASRNLDIEGEVADIMSGIMSNISQSRVEELPEDDPPALKEQDTGKENEDVEKVVDSGRPPCETVQPG